MAELIGAAASEWLRSFAPTPALAMTLGALATLYVLAASRLAGWLRIGRGMGAPYTRKVFHFAIFTAAGVVHLASGLPGVAVFGTVVSLRVLYAVWRGDGDTFYEAIARPSDAPHRTLFVLVPLATTALGGVLANLLFGPFASVGYLVCGWGDAVGEPVGTRWGRHRYRAPTLTGVPAARSLEGSAAVCLVGAAAAALGLLAAGVGPGTALPVGLACGLAGAVVEAVSAHGLDNLTTQLAASGVAALLLGR